MESSSTKSQDPLAWYGDHHFLWVKYDNNVGELQLYETARVEYYLHYGLPYPEEGEENYVGAPVITLSQVISNPDEKVILKSIYLISQNKNQNLKKMQTLF